ncbi:minichromosome maintenance protein 4 (cell division control protein 54) [Wickerhamomyces ciferrii]|uniref:DNA replication licensing factor MCM4 n=1 Tax=Wickerhamomyces ciferrii (strain ATCC 14091 / BCRC 22168 / CBS 111 / JCM 3599 / NBRC 0793 / NRRL Y-1031 F-60-10) TaxID=1206466 RepID=K0KKH6_WICCF|nr:minichromosome maintenance protein 4 (cell division control protein 54) [Wickerhamomyces ciferrii]CCH41623.1 minichromosome maintenance protein 4 (cell division control protein 54) [Wickerhamomyces ciferrii]
MSSPSHNQNSTSQNRDDTNQDESLTQADSFGQTNAVPSSPLFMPESSDVDETQRQQQQQQQRNSQRGASNVSSPIFFRSSQPGSQASSRPGSEHGGIGEPSSPLNFPSSAPGSDYPRSDISRSSRRGPGRSDLGSDIYADISSRRRAEQTRHRRGDIHSSDISSPMRRRVFNNNQIPSSQPGNISSNLGNEDIDEPVRIIWGTNVSIHECSNAFRNFLMSFKMKYRKLHDSEPVDDIADNELYYVNELNSMRNSLSTNLNLDAKNLLTFAQTKKLFYQLQNYPQEVIPIMDQTVKDCMVSLIVENDLDHDISDIEGRIYKIRPFNIESQRGMRELNPEDIDKLVSVKGMVLRSTPVIPDMKMAFFKCNICDHTTVVEIDRGVIQEPTVCPRPACAQPNSMILVHVRSSFADKQVVKLQETPDHVPDGQTPHSVSLCVYDELVDSVKAGDRIEATGIFRSVPVRVNSRQRAMKSLFKIYLDLVHIRKIDKKRMNIDTSTNTDSTKQVNHDVDEVRKITEEEVQKIKETGARPDLYELLARSMAPSIYELDDVKKGILLQLFGGTNKTFTKGGKYRGDINILLCGDPSTSKSQLLQYVHKIAPRGVYTSGKGSSAVGLTAYVTRDIDTRQLVLESGALVLSDGGVCCIDEFDKMSDVTRSVLHEAMEQQTISIAKAGIITTLNARTSILASANPINSRYDPNLPVTSNIDLPPPLLSRFDLVYLLLDKVDERTDRYLAKHLTSMYLEDTPENVSTTEILPVEFLTLYISYAKENYAPVLQPEAKDELVKSYVDMRKLGDDSRSSERRITATTRQLESMIRLSEAHAKMRLSNVVELKDVKEAVRLIKSAIKDYATDPITGKIDMDLVQTGQSSAQRRMKEDLSKTVYDILEQYPGDVITFIDLQKALNEQSQEVVENNELGDVLNRLVQQDKVIVNGEGSRRMIRLSRR